MSILTELEVWYGYNVETNVKSIIMISSPCSDRIAEYDVLTKSNEYSILLTDILCSKVRKR